MAIPGANLKTRMTDSVRGSFGLFTNAGNRQIAYLNTRFLASELQQIKIVRQVIPRHVLRIRELMQRDIDDVRVRSEVVQYLTPQQGVIRARFFPPIVVAALPIPSPTDFELPLLYPPPRNYAGGQFPVVVDKNEDISYEERIFGDTFGFRIPLDEGTSSENSDLFHGCELVWNRDKLTMVAIDGQHRLLAIKSILGMLQEEDRARGYERCQLDPLEKQELGFSSIPVCIVAPWMLFEGNDNLSSSDNIVGVFRQIFVDVNKNAKTVSASRNILLDEQNLVSIFTRNMVDSFVVESGLSKTTPVGLESIALYQFEWDSPDGKEFQINDPRAISSVGLLNKIVHDLLGGLSQSEDTFRNWLRIEEGDEELSPDSTGKAGVDPVNIASTKFSSWQRTLIEGRFKKYIQPSLTHILRNIYPARQLIDKLESKRIELEKKDQSEEGNAIPKCSLDFLLGSRGDQTQIRDMCALDHPVGSFDPDVCKATVKEMAADFLKREIEPERQKPFARIFFSNVGQSEVFDFILTTLRQNASEDVDCMDLTRNFISAFNVAFEDSPKNQQLFASTQSWNSLTIEKLSTVKYKQQHIVALLKISLCFIRDASGLEKVLDRWEATRRHLVNDGISQIRHGLTRRLSQQIASRSEIREILNEKKRRTALDRKVGERVDEIICELAAFVSDEAKFDILE
jgi:hypothetical protein